MKSLLARIGRLLRNLVLLVLVVVLLGVGWLRWDAYKLRDHWYPERQGTIDSVAVSNSQTPHGQLSELVYLGSDSGLNVTLRTIRDAAAGGPLPVLLVLGGHRTGSDAVDLFGDVGALAVVGIDYPYDGPQKVRGVAQTLTTIPRARQAFLDTVPAVSLAVDWLHLQPWVDRDRIVVVGASLGVPFATRAAARDDRITGLMLVHGAAENQPWMEVQVARRIDPEFLHYPLSVLLNWLAYGPILNAGEFVAELAPRPVVIIGAKHDERTPPGQAELLFGNAGEPKHLRYTGGLHIQPNRPEIIGDLLRIAAEEMTFLTQQKRPAR